MPSPGSNAAWLDSQTPWPKKFGLGRMRTLLAALGDPQLAYPADPRRRHERQVDRDADDRGAAPRARASRSASTISPHIRGWAERIRVDGEPADFEAAVGRVRPEAEAQEATQFETVCAAAFAEFAAREVDVAVVEAGLGGRLDATNVLRSHVVLLTNVGLEHTDVLGDTREQIAAEKLAVVQEGSVAVLPDEEFAHLAGPNVVVGGAREAAEAFLGRPVEREVTVVAARKAGAAWGGGLGRGAQRRRRRLARPAARARAATCCASPCCATRTPPRCSPSSPRWAARSSRRSPRIRAPCRPRSSRASPSRYFDVVEIEPDPAAALARAREHGRVLVTGSLYLIADLSRNDA